MVEIRTRFKVIGPLRFFFDPKHLNMGRGREVTEGTNGISGYSVLERTPFLQRFTQSERLLGLSKELTNDLRAARGSP